MIREIILDYVPYSVAEPRGRGAMAPPYLFPPEAAGTPRLSRLLLGPPTPPLAMIDGSELWLTVRLEEMAPWRPGLDSATVSVRLRRQLWWWSMKLWR